MKTGLVGPSYQERSPNLDAQRTVNLYPVLDPQGRALRNAGPRRLRADQQPAGARHVSGGERAMLRGVGGCAF